MKYKMNTLYNMDCMEAMKDIPDKYFELAIVDPPYGINVSKTGNVGGEKLAKVKNYGVKDWDKSPPNKEYFEEMIRISKNQIVWGANHFISKIPIDSSCWLVWDKNNSGNFADCELAWTSFKTTVRKFEYTWNGMLQGDMKNKENRIHPTQKPIALYEWLLNNYAKQGDKILDTHVGSASSLIACYNLGFDYMGFELDEDYYKSAIKRIEARKSQMDIFNDLGIDG